MQPGWVGLLHDKGRRVIYGLYQVESMGTNLDPSFGPTLVCQVRPWGGLFVEEVSTWHCAQRWAQGPVKAWVTTQTLCLFACTGTGQGCPRHAPRRTTIALLKGCAV